MAPSAGTKGVGHAAAGRGGGAGAAGGARGAALGGFDLDDTVWYPEMYMLSGAPFRRVSPAAVKDCRGEVVSVYPGARQAVAEILTAPEWVGRGTMVAYASRTECGEWAEECLRLLSVAGRGGEEVSLWDAAAYKEIYEGSKVQHFAALHEKTGLDYGDMLFFDNERWNITEVGRLGVKCVYTPGGMTDAHWTEGVEMFSK